MGVTSLWQILSPVQQHCSLSSLRGQTLAVDLSIWVCENQSVKQMQGIVSKPHLRNLFFRISHLIQLGVHLVFVVEGNAPELKQDVMIKRQQARSHQLIQQPGRSRGGKKNGRRNFNCILKECCEMLDYLGVPYVQSQGEAEAMCAALNAAQLVDACITNDGDAFLYGARTVYRNFTMNSKDPHVERYTLEDIEQELSLDREKLVAMALLLGCDYLPKGVPGVGMDKAVKLMKGYDSIKVLKRFGQWRQMVEGECISKVEEVVRKKSISVKDFPQMEVVAEFMVSKDTCPPRIQVWKRPKISEMQTFAAVKLEWPEEYTLEKMLPLVTFWDMTSILSGRSMSSLLQPKSIIKKRVRQGVDCFEIQWDKDFVCCIGEMTEENFVTIEEKTLFTSCFPDLVESYNQQVGKKKPTKGKKKKVEISQEATEHADKAQTVHSSITSQSSEAVLCSQVSRLNLNDKVLAAPSTTTTSTGNKQKAVESPSTGNIGNEQTGQEEEDLRLKEDFSPAQGEDIITESQVFCSEFKSLTDRNFRDPGSPAKLQSIISSSGHMEENSIHIHITDYEGRQDKHGYHDDINDSDILLSFIEHNRCAEFKNKDTVSCKTDLIGVHARCAIDKTTDTETVDLSDVPLSERIKRRMNSNSSAKSHNQHSKKSFHVKKVADNNVSETLDCNMNLASCRKSEEKDERTLLREDGVMNKRNKPRVKPVQGRGWSPEIIDKENTPPAMLRTLSQTVCTKRIIDMSRMSPATVRDEIQHSSPRNHSIHSPCVQSSSPCEYILGTKHLNALDMSRICAISTPQCGEMMTIHHSERTKNLEHSPLFIDRSSASENMSEKCAKMNLASQNIKQENGEDWFITKSNSGQQSASDEMNVDYKCGSPYTVHSVLTKSSKNLHKSILQHSLLSNTSMNSTVGSFAIEYGNFNISTSLLHNFSQHSLLLSLMSDENELCGSPFGSSPVENDRKLVVGKNITRHESVHVGAIAKENNQSNRNSVSSPLFEEINKLSYSRILESCYDRKVVHKCHKSSGNIDTNALTELVQELSFTETDTDSLHVQADLQNRTSSEREECYNSPALDTSRVISMDTGLEPSSTASFNFDKSDNLNPNQRYSTPRNSVSNNRKAVKMEEEEEDLGEAADQSYPQITSKQYAIEESPVSLLDRLKNKMKKGANSVLLQDFISQRKVSVKSINKLTSQETEVEKGIPFNNHTQRFT